MSVFVPARAYRRSEYGAWHIAPAAADTRMPIGDTLCGRRLEPREISYALDVDELTNEQRLELCRECRLEAGESWLPQ